MSRECACKFIMPWLRARAGKFLCLCGFERQQPSSAIIMALLRGLRYYLMSDTVVIVAFPKSIKKFAQTTSPQSLCTRSLYLVFLGDMYKAYAYSCRRAMYMRTPKTGDQKLMTIRIETRKLSYRRDRWRGSAVITPIKVIQGH